ncbi:MAG: hypothetical protein J5982_00255 [Bacilli bacterium]|nr:hypothetical protein [Bacilli bacterium]
MKKYVIGLDLGINNFVWSILNAEDKTLVKAGVRSFAVSESAENRRNARSI